VCEDHYLPNEFNYIQYEASSGGLSCPESDVRHSYYADNGTGIPDIRFDGSWYAQVGAPESDSNGLFYISKIDNRRTTTSPLAVVVSDFSYTEPGAFAQVSVKMFGDIPNPANHYIRVAIVEDDLTYGSSVYQNVCRDMLPDATGTPLTVSQAGQEQVVDLDIAMQAGWDAEKLQIIAWVQNDANKEIINSGNSFVGEFAAVASVAGEQQVIADGGEVTFGPVTITNIGLAGDTYDVALDASDLPEGWDAHMVYDGSEYQSFAVTIEPYGAADFNVMLNAGLEGSGRVSVTITSQVTGELVESLDFVAIAGGTDLLVVADDGAGAGFDVYGPAIAAAGKSYAVWDRSMAAVAGTDLDGYEAVVWEVGNNGDAMVQSDRLALDAYMNGGGNVVLAGDDFLQSLYDQGGSALLWYQLRLRINYGSGNSGNLQIDGVPGDIIGDGVAFTLTGGDPDQPVLINNQPVEVSCTYGDGDPAVLRTTYGAYKAVLFPFSLENVPTQAQANDLIYGALDWFGILGVTDVDLPVAQVALAQNTPNPFNPMTKIAFSLDRSGPAKLEIFNARGQLVRVLNDGVLAAGAHEVTWAGRTDNGQQAASGTYFYRLTTEDQTLTRKMSLVK
jgi:hypothetical protein